MNKISEIDLDLYKIIADANESAGTLVKLDYSELNQFIFTIEAQAKELEQLRNQLKVAVEALEWYADEDNYVWRESGDDPFDFPHQKVDDDSGNTAENALSLIQGKENSHVD